MIILNKIKIIKFKKGNIKELKINQQISSPQVILIDEKGTSQGAVSIDQALYLAFEAGLDLVEVNASGSVSVTKIMDYGKYRYAQEKQESKQKSKSRGPELKEIRLSLKISEHDLDFKLRQAEKFLADGDKVKVTVKLIGREMMFSSKVNKLLESIRQKLHCKFESKVERLGTRFSTILARDNSLLEKKDETKNS